MMQVISHEVFIKVFTNTGIAMYLIEIHVFVKESMNTK